MVLQSVQHRLAAGPQISAAKAWPPHPAAGSRVCLEGGVSEGPASVGGREAGLPTPPPSHLPQALFCARLSRCIRCVSHGWTGRQSFLSVSLRHSWKVRMIEMPNLQDHPVDSRGTECTPPTLGPSLPPGAPCPDHSWCSEASKLRL